MALLSLNKAYQALKKRAKDFAKEQGAVTAVEFGLSFGTYLLALFILLEMARYIWISGLIDYAFEKSVLKVKNAPATFGPKDFYQEFVDNLNELNKNSIGLFAMDPEPLNPENVNRMKFFRIGDLAEFLRNDPAGYVFTSMSGWTCSAKKFTPIDERKKISESSTGQELLDANTIAGSSPCLYKAFFHENSNWDKNGNRLPNTLPWEYSGYDNVEDTKYLGLTTLAVIYKYKTLIPLPYLGTLIGNINRGTVEVVESKLKLSNSIYEKRNQPAQEAIPTTDASNNNGSGTQTAQSSLPQTGGNTGSQFIGAPAGPGSSNGIPKPSRGKQLAQP